LGSGQSAIEERVVAYRLKFSERAACEVGAAYEWYETQSQGLGLEFELAFELQLKRLEQVPLLYPEVVSGVRRTLLPRFPYGVFYVVRGDLVQILAVVHNARNPKRWPGAASR
jgi:plasmid stabilization system protein ParE